MYRIYDTTTSLHIYFWSALDVQWSLDVWFKCMGLLFDWEEGWLVMLKWSKMQCNLAIHGTQKCSAISR